MRTLYMYCARQMRERQARAHLAPFSLFLDVGRADLVVAADLLAGSRAEAAKAHHARHRRRVIVLVLLAALWVRRWRCARLDVLHRRRA